MSARERERLKKIREYVINRDGLICCYCEKALILSDVTLEHIVPSSKRGTFNATNLTVSCYNCNNSRGNKPFFDYIKKFDFNELKLLKYKKLYFSNLRIKILNIAKEECLKEEAAVPAEIVRQACLILKIKDINFSDFDLMDINFNEACPRKIIKYNFEKLIRMIEADSK